MKKCDYCEGSDIKRKHLMSDTDNNVVIINSCGYLEESRTSINTIGIYIGVKINFCPMCGRKLNNL